MDLSPAAHTQLLPTDYSQRPISVQSAAHGRVNSLKARDVSHDVLCLTHVSFCLIYHILSLPTLATLVLPSFFMWSCIELYLLSCFLE